MRVNKFPEGKSVEKNRKRKRKAKTQSCRMSTLTI